MNNVDFDDHARRAGAELRRHAADHVAEVPAFGLVQRRRQRRRAAIAGSVAVLLLTIGIASSVGRDDPDSVQVVTDPPAEAPVRPVERDRSDATTAPSSTVAPSTTAASGIAPVAFEFLPAGFAERGVEEREVDPNLEGAIRRATIYFVGPGGARMNATVTHFEDPSFPREQVDRRMHPDTRTTQELLGSEILDGNRVIADFLVTPGEPVAWHSSVTNLESALVEVNSPDVDVGVLHAVAASATYGQ